MVAIEWSTSEREAWAPPAEMKPSEWAQRYRWLPKGQTHRAGPWDNDYTPYLRGIMDLCTAPGVAQLNIMKAAQIGVSEALRNVIGYAADQEGDPVGLGLPDKSKGRKIVGNRVIPMFRACPRLARLCTDRLHDLQKEQILLRNGWLLHLMWSGSPSAMASDPMRRCFNDEVDKFAAWTGAEAGPVELTLKRLRTYEDRACQVNCSTPTTRFGMIYQLWEGSDVRLYFMVPCPQCGAFQTLDFANLKWGHADIEDRKERAALVKKTGDVWYECGVCEAHIPEHDRSAMLQAGRWGTEDGSIEDAEAVERWPAGTRLAIQISSLYCPWVSWADTAREFLLSVGNLSKMLDFRTQTLGEPFEQQVEHTRATFFSDKCKAATLPEGMVPKWSAKLLATIDTQHDHFWVVVRAWGPGMRSARVWHGRIETFEGLDKLIFYDKWRVQDDARPAPMIELALIDSGGTKMEGEAQSRTMEVYRWVLGRRARVRPIKGAAKSRAGLFMWHGKAFIDDGVPKSRRRKRAELRLFHVYTHHWRDELAFLMTATEKDEADGIPLWQLNDRDDPEYNEHLANMNKVTVRQGTTAAEEWLPVGRGLRHDLHDCEAYQVAAAYMALVHTLPGMEELEKLRSAIHAPPPAAPSSGTQAAESMAMDSWEKHL